MVSVFEKGNSTTKLLILSDELMAASVDLFQSKVTLLRLNLRNDIINFYTFSSPALPSMFTLHNMVGGAQAHCMQVGSPAPSSVRARTTPYRIMRYDLVTITLHRYYDGDEARRFCVARSRSFGVCTAAALS